MARRSTRMAEKVAQSSPSILSTVSPSNKKAIIKKELKVDLSSSKITKYLCVRSPSQESVVIKKEPDSFSEENQKEYENCGKEKFNNTSPIKASKKELIIPVSAIKEDKNGRGVDDGDSPASQESTKLSEYEKQILRNIEERKKMFQMMVGDAKKDFMATLPTPAKEKAKATQRGLKRKVEESVEIPPLRMSLRSRKQPGDELKTELIEEKKQTVSRPSMSGSFKMTDAYLDQDSVEDAKLMDEMIPLLEKEGELEKLPEDQQDFLKLMKSFHIQEEGVAKVTKSRIYSLDWHPSTCKLLLAVGDRDGHVGFWDVDKVDDKHQGVRAFRVHGMPINCTTFDKFNATRLITTSYDGNVRCMDLQTNVIDEIYSIKRTQNTWTAYHAQKDSSTVIVSQSNGDVVVVDVRTKPSRVQNLIQCFEMSARSVSLHPQDENLFMICNRYGEIGIYDLRYTADNEDDLAVPVIGFPKAPKGVHGAFFSPNTGKYALTTCTDDTLKLYDVQKGISEAICIKSISHNNFTGRWLTPFKAVWHPQRDDVFIVGSMEHPRRVELYGAPTGQLLHNFNGEWLASILSINAFHPSVPIFAGGNSSGRVHVFRS